MRYLILSNKTLQDKTEYEKAFNCLKAGGIEYSFIYKIIFPILEKIIPEKVISYCTDLPINQAEIIGIKKDVEERLSELINAREEVADNALDRYVILGKPIQLNLRESQDRIIDSLDSVHKVIEDCLANNHDMYLTISDK